MSNFNYIPSDSSIKSANSSTNTRTTTTSNNTNPDNPDLTDLEKRVEVLEEWKAVLSNAGLTSGFVDELSQALASLQQLNLLEAIHFPTVSFYDPTYLRYLPQEFKFIVDRYSDNGLAPIALSTNLITHSGFSTDGQDIQIAQYATTYEPLDSKIATLQLHSFKNQFELILQDADGNSQSTFINCPTLKMKLPSTDGTYSTNSRLIKRHLHHINSLLSRELIQIASVDDEGNVKISIQSGKVTFGRLQAGKDEIAKWFMTTIDVDLTDEPSFTRNQVIIPLDTDKHSLILSPDSSVFTYVPTTSATWDKVFDNELKLVANANIAAGLDKERNNIFKKLDNSALFGQALINGLYTIAYSNQLSNKVVKMEQLAYDLPSPLSSEISPQPISLHSIALDTDVRKEIIVSDGNESASVLLDVYKNANKIGNRDYYDFGHDVEYIGLRVSGNELIVKNANGTYDLAAALNGENNTASVVLTLDKTDENGTITPVNAELLMELQLTMGSTEYNGVFSVEPDGTVQRFEAEVFYHAAPEDFVTDTHNDYWTWPGDGFTTSAIASNNIQGIALNGESGASLPSSDATLYVGRLYKFTGSSVIARLRILDDSFLPLGGAGSVAFVLNGNAIEVAIKATTWTDGDDIRSGLVSDDFSLDLKQDVLGISGVSLGTFDEELAEFTNERGRAAQVVDGGNSMVVGEEHSKYQRMRGQTYDQDFGLVYSDGRVGNVKRGVALGFTGKLRLNSSVHQLVSTHHGAHHYWGITNLQNGLNAVPDSLWVSPGDGDNTHGPRPDWFNEYLSVATDGTFVSEAKPDASSYLTTPFDFQITSPPVSVSIDSIKISSIPLLIVPSSDAQSTDFINEILDLQSQIKYLYSLGLQEFMLLENLDLRVDALEKITNSIIDALNNMGPSQSDKITSMISSLVGVVGMMLGPVSGVASALLIIASQTIMAAYEMSEGDPMGAIELAVLIVSAFGAILASGKAKIGYELPEYLESTLNGSVYEHPADNPKFTSDDVSAFMKELREVVPTLDTPASRKKWLAKNARKGGLNISSGVNRQVYIPQGAEELDPTNPFNPSNPYYLPEAFDVIEMSGSTIIEACNTNVNLSPDGESMIGQTDRSSVVMPLSTITPEYMNDFQKLMSVTCPSKFEGFSALAYSEEVYTPINNPPGDDADFSKWWHSYDVKKSQRGWEAIEEEILTVEQVRARCTLVVSDDEINDWLTWIQARPELSNLKTSIYCPTDPVLLAYSMVPQVGTYQKQGDNMVLANMSSVKTAFSYGRFGLEKILNVMVSPTDEK